MKQMHQCAHGSEEDGQTIARAHALQIGITARILSERPPAEGEPCTGGLPALTDLVTYRWSDDPAQVAVPPPPPPPCFFAFYP